jgi:hypothetical protein
MHSTQPKPIRRTARIPALAALASASLIAAGCGGKPSGSAVANIGATTTASSPGNSQSSQSGGQEFDQARAFSACMRKNGVPSFPDPTEGGGLTINKVQLANAPQFRSAEAKCRKLRPHGEAPSPAEQAQMQAQALRYSACMRSHGVPKFPDPQFEGAGIKLALGRGIDPASPTFQSAQRACESVMPGLKGKGGPGGGNTKGGSSGPSTGSVGAP